jgi:toxin ParE1/3/4
VSRHVLRRARAQADIRALSFHIAEDNPDAARRFLTAVERSLALLADMPRLGAPRRTGNPALAGLRMHPVRGFENHLIFYRPLRGGIELVRVLHGARDIGAILRAEPGPGEEG